MVLFFVRKILLVCNVCRDIVLYANGSDSSHTLPIQSCGILFTSSCSCCVRALFFQTMAQLCSRNYATLITLGNCTMIYLQNAPFYKNNSPWPSICNTLILQCTQTVVPVVTKLCNLCMFDVRWPKVFECQEIRNKCTSHR